MDVRGIPASVSLRISASGSDTWDETLNMIAEKLRQLTMRRISGAKYRGLAIDQIPGRLTPDCVVKMAQLRRIPIAIFSASRIGDSKSSGNPRKSSRLRPNAHGVRNIVPRPSSKYGHVGKPGIKRQPAQGVPAYRGDGCDRCAERHRD